MLKKLKFGISFILVLLMVSLPLSALAAEPTPPEEDGIPIVPICILPEEWE